MFEAAGVDELRESLGAAGAGLAAAAGFDPAVAERRELCAAAVELERLRRSLDAAQGRVLAELHSRNATAGLHALRTSRWLARDAKLPAGVARQRVTVAAHLDRFLPEVADAQREGRVGFDHARVFADAVNERNAGALAAAAEQFVQAAQHTAFEVWRRDVQAFAELMDPDGGHDPAGDLLRTS